MFPVLTKAKHKVMTDTKIIALRLNQIKKFADPLPNRDINKILLPALNNLLFATYCCLTHLHGMGMLATIFLSFKLKMASWLSSFGPIRTANLFPIPSTSLRKGASLASTKFSV